MSKKREAVHLEYLPVSAAKKLVLDVTEDLLSGTVVDAVTFA